MAAIAMALTVPPPPVNQGFGLYDATVETVASATCISCHPTPANIHHSMIPSRTPYGCLDCHPTRWNASIPPVGAYEQYKERTCVNCHNGTAFWANPIVNLTAIRPPSGKPHHNTTYATTRQCAVCHGIGSISNYDPASYTNGAIPTYYTSMVTPYADNKIYNATGYNPNNPANPGRYWGGCLSCHQNSTNTGLLPAIKSNYDTHHGEVLYQQIRKDKDPIKGTVSCNWCHVVNPAGSLTSLVRITAAAGQGGPLNSPNASAGYPYGRILELRNSTIQVGMGDPANGTACEQCHTLRSLHNIQPNGWVAGGLGAAGYGHINNNSDCNGCHAFWDAGVDNRPFADALGADIYSVTPGTLTADVQTTVTITGMLFDQASSGYTTEVLVDGIAIPYTSLTNTDIVVNVPPQNVGAHDIQVAVHGITTKLYQLTVVAPPTITSAKLDNGVLTITGTGFGAAQQYVTIGKGGSIIFSDSITNWSGTQIVATSSVAAIGDTVTVTTSTGEATATIEAGTVVPSITVTSPNGGENWKRGTTYTITWTSVGSTGTNVKIELLKGTSVVKTISKSTLNDGSFGWPVPGNLGATTNYKVRITSTSNSAYKDESDNFFQISK